MVIDDLPLAIVGTLWSIEGVRDSSELNKNKYR
jgi:hypothetical protein